MEYCLQEENHAKCKQEERSAEAADESTYSFQRPAVHVVSIGDYSDGPRRRGPFFWCDGDDKKAYDDASDVDDQAA